MISLVKKNKAHSARKIKHNTKKKVKLTSKHKPSYKHKTSKIKVKNKKLNKKQDIKIVLKPALKVKEVKKDDNIKKLYEERERLEMENLSKILSEPFARQLLIELAGENALEIVRNFYGNQSDEELAKKLKIKISDVRATLNKLHSEGLVNYSRDKDNETGWYSYSWSLNKEKIENWVSITLREKNDLSKYAIDHYFCPTCRSDSVVSFDIATESQFKCQRCGKDLEFLDEQKIIEMKDLFQFRK